MDLAAEKKKFIAVSQVRYGQALAKGFHVSGSFMDGNLQKRWLGWLECVRSREAEGLAREAELKRRLETAEATIKEGVYAADYEALQQRLAEAEKLLRDLRQCNANEVWPICNEVDTFLANPGCADEIVSRQEVENFLVQYHEQVWEAASDAEMNVKPRVDYDEAGRELAKAFLSRFQ